MQIGTPSFPIVGIGASAGGLGAFTALLQSLPDNLGMAYIIVQHLDPKHESSLSSLLARVTTMPVQETRNDMSIEPNHVYVIPPDTEMIVEQGRLKLRPWTETQGRRRSIDTFLCSLAESLQRQAIGVILSGTASDGARGLQAIKAQGGITFAQDEPSASYFEMPHSAIVTGCVDFIRSPEGIARELTQIGQHPYIHLLPEKDPDELFAAQEPPLQDILLVLQRNTGVDFTVYKLTTVKRRLFRRMMVLHINSLSEYLAYLMDNVSEVEALYQDLLIPVTEFFRDPLAFQALTREAFPDMLKTKVSGDAIRMWVPGCATGEEVYSLAICLHEFLAEHSLTPPIQIFGTDLNAVAIEKARAGSYSLDMMEKVSPERLQRFFHLIEGRYQIHKSIRDLCVFAQQNICQDPPFSQLDVLSCRNLLIYLTPQAQQKVFQAFHYALRPHGFLLLGAAETANASSKLFDCIDRKQKLYVKKATGTIARFNVAKRQFEGVPRTPGKMENRMYENAVGGWDIQKEADRLLLARYVPASVVINSEMEILHFRGRTSPYLEPASGRASLHLLKMAHEGLTFALRTAITQVRKTGHPVKKEAIQVLAQSGKRLVTIEVIPLKASTSEGYFLVLFEDVPLPVLPTLEASTSSEHQMSAESDGAKDHWIKQLELELVASREELRSVIEELEAANEELQSSNEEILSSNEEFQSLNEELETSKEEIQASNEELLTINQELQATNEQLRAARDYNTAIVETVREPLLILSAGLHIQRANRAFYQFFQTVPEATEQRYLYEIGGGQWNIPQLRGLLEEVLSENRTFQDFEVNHTFSSIGDKILLLNARCIAGVKDRDALILLAFEDITERKELERHREAFLGIASHELKTPVTSIKAYTQMLHRQFMRAGDSASATQLAKLDAQLNKLTNLMSELLDTTRIQDKIEKSRIAPFNVNELVREIVEDVQRTTEQHQIRVEGVIHEQLSGDRERISQILMNLLSNAIKYSPEAGTILVRLKADRDKVTLSVQDFGIGIAVGQQAHLFERFYRVSDPMHETIPGLGLGLYIVSEIVKLHGGRIWVESHEGAGSTFFVSLPWKP